MSRDVSPEVCGWCGVEMPCGCDDDVGGVDDMDGDEPADSEKCTGECGPHPCESCFAALQAERDAVPREPGCQCQIEAGDSPCQVHGEEEP